MWNFAICFVLVCSLAAFATLAAEAPTDPVAILDAVAESAAPVQVGAAALMLSHAINPAIDVAAYSKRLDEMANELRAPLAAIADDKAKLEAMSAAIYGRWKFADQQSLPANVFVSLADVLDKRQWNCFGLSVLYIALGERLGLPLELVSGRGHALVHLAHTPLYAETTQRGEVHEGIEYLARYLPFPCLNPAEYKPVDARTTVAVLLTQTGQAVLAQGNVPIAESCFRHALKFNATFAETHAAMGFLSLQRNDADKAVAEFQAAIKSDPSLREAYGGLSNALHARGDLQGAIDAVRKGVSLCDKQPELVFNLGQLLYENGKIDDAETQYRAYTQLAPNDPDGFTSLAFPLEDRGKFDEAIAAYRQALRLQPQLVGAMINIAGILEKQTKFEDARAQYEQALQIADNNALAHAGMGRTLAALNQLEAAAKEFDRALALDAALGSAWLGRGLALLRLRERDEALHALETAAALDPRRAEHRAYLGKGFAERGEAELARKEYRLARDLDSADPTAWLYSALLEWEENRPNRAVSDLEQSVALNDNRQVFRSRLGLDRDLAVRRADLAAVYRDAGLFEVSRRSASRAVVDDYANFAGHLFLANSYQEVEDPGRFDLRYETTRVSELLLANLLAPPSGANLSQRVSQQEHLQMFDGRPFGANSYTEYRSGGDWRQEASFFGSLDGFAYALDTAFVWENGTGGNTERERSDVSLQLKQQVGERDDVYLQLAFMGAEAGDVARHHDPAEAKPDFHVEEEQVPNLHLGWHRAWTPDSHTLLLFSRLTDRLELHDGQPEVLFLRQRDGGTASVSTPPFFDLRYESRFTLYSAEVQQLWQWEDHEVIAGVSGQAGTIEPEAWLDRPAGVPVTAQAFDDPLRRVTAYFYDHWRLTEWLRLVAGVSYDRLTHPLNSESAPLTEGDVTRDLVAPKAGLVVTPWKDGLVRGSYTRSLGGVYFDNSVRLEPTQVAGFNQAFRSLLPESVAGLVPGTEFETFGVGVDQKLGPVHFGVEAEWLQSTGDRLVGALTNSLPLPVPDSASGTRQELDFREGSVAAYAVVLIGDGLSLGARYRLSEATYEERFPGIPTGAAGRERLESDVRAVLRQATLSAGYLHASGAFFRWETQWFAQENDGYVPALAGDDFWQHDVWVGYRWPRRRAEIRAGVLNLTDTDYRLNPLNAWPALPRERTAVVSLRLNF